MYKKIALITGGCGLLGWEYAKSLNEINCKVIILDNASSHRNKKVKDLIKEKTIYCIPFHTNIIQMLLKISLVS